MPVPQHKVVGFDIGAKRCGWAYVNKIGDDYKLVSSGVTGIERRADEEYGDYRSRLIRYWCRECDWLIGRDPDRDTLHSVWVERVPFSGISTAAAAQRVLAMTVGIVIEAHCSIYGFDFNYIAESTVKKRLTGAASTKTNKVSKVKVRDHVLEVFPELLPRKKELTQTHDEVDAVAVALIGAGYDRKNRTLSGHP